MKIVLVEFNSCSTMMSKTAFPVFLLLFILLNIPASHSGAQCSLNKKTLNHIKSLVSGVDSIPNHSNRLNISSQIIDAPGKTFGYDIFSSDRLIIHQPCIPTVPGIGGFKSKADAEKVARLVISKIKNGVMPPTLTIAELKDLNVL